MTKSKSVPETVRERAARDGYDAMTDDGKRAWRGALIKELECHPFSVTSALKPPRKLGRPREYKPNEYCPVCAAHVPRAKRERVKQAVEELVKK